MLPPGLAACQYPSCRNTVAAYNTVRRRVHGDHAVPPVLWSVLWYVSELCLRVHFCMRGLGDSAGSCPFLLAFLLGFSAVAFYSKNLPDVVC